MGGLQGPTKKREKTGELTILLVPARVDQAWTERSTLFPTSFLVQPIRALFCSQIPKFLSLPCNSWLAQWSDYGANNAKGFHSLRRNYYLKHFSFPISTDPTSSIESAALHPIIVYIYWEKNTCIEVDHRVLNCVGSRVKCIFKTSVG